ncbi:EAL domain, c-di-GMP-specific phosphodiesterase class I (or its enzymatically inactive variant) [Pseudomonas simiae]|uniref:EAL domain-containing protein n=1 Tax=Pseudomonas simiae TaxID=321846 RepID=UPI00084D2300|nr:EAL domain-containing protein [Pseudomonas simiae]SFB39623.1 EAL domain, c-di-GMP-specific phosphodiesterase class I (or its enzymatically inactive variant) [Pseudomonas simiae]
MHTALSLQSAVSSGRRLTTPAKADTVDASEIRRGLLLGEFKAYVQPKFQLSNNAVDSLEVLARWRHPELGLLAPAAFIPTMIREQLLDDLLCELLDQGLAGQIQLHAGGRELGVAFNLSLMQLANPELVSHLMTRLKKHPLPLSSVTLEITEDGPAVADEICVQNAIRLRQLGVRLSLDDYGTGHSSLFRLCQLPFDEIKLAGEFTQQLLRSSMHRSVARATVMLARESGMRLVVEGIETEEQRHCLAQKGVRIGQGYLCARPMSADALLQWLAA